LKMSHELSDTQNVCVGVGAAFIEAVLLQPTLYWKNARAQNLPFTLNPKIVYRGTFTSIMNEMQMMGVQFGLTGALQRLYISIALGAAIGDKVNFSFMDEVLVATVGGCISAITTSPVELVMIQQQLKGGSIPYQLTSIIKNHGILSNGMGRGLSQSIARDGIYTCGLLGITPATQNILINKYNYSERQAGFYASIIGGVTCAAISHPFDMVKTVLQGDLEKKKYGTVSETYKLLYNSPENGGPTRFFNGLFWRSINIIGTIFIANEVRVYASRAILERKDNGGVTK